MLSSCRISDTSVSSIGFNIGSVVVLVEILGVVVVNLAVVVVNIGVDVTEDAVVLATFLLSLLKLWFLLLSNNSVTGFSDCFTRSATDNVAWLRDSSKLNVIPLLKARDTSVSQNLDQGLRRGSP